MNTSSENTKDNLENIGSEPILNSLIQLDENGSASSWETTDVETPEPKSETVKDLDSSTQQVENENIETENLSEISESEVYAAKDEVPEVETVAEQESDLETHNISEIPEGELPDAESELNESVSVESIEADALVSEESVPLPHFGTEVEIEGTSKEATENADFSSPEFIGLQPEATHFQEELPETEDEIAEDEHVDDDAYEAKLQFDYSKFSKKELFKLIEELAKEPNPVIAYKLAAKMKPTWDSFYDLAKQESFEMFIGDGGESDSFEFKGDELDQKAFGLFKKFREAFKADQNRKKEALMGNLQAKLELVAKLRSIVNSEDTNIDIKSLREIQETWRRTGPVPPEQFENLNASYQFLINKFYDNRNIFFEMLELDRKKNLAAKTELIEKAENLSNEPSVVKAIKVALQLQKEFQDVGPVPQEIRDEIWNKFRSAMDKVFERRKEHFEALKIEAAKETDAKLAILEKLGQPSSFQSDRFDQWNNKTKEIQTLQDEWKAVKHVPGGKTEELTKQFWSEIKKFFHNKNEFFKQLDAVRNQNLQLKNELVEKAEALKESDNWDATTLEYKLLRDEWKTIGPTPFKVSEAIYKRFNAAIDYFFERKKQKFNVQRESEKKNLELKNEIISKVEAMAAQKKGNMEDVENFRDEFNAIGYVPHKDVGNVVGRFHKAIDDLILNSKDMDDDHKTKNRLKVQVSHASSSNEGYNKLQKQENYIRRRIIQLTEDIENLKNNMGFFANTKNAQSFLADYNKKVQLAELEIKELREQLKIINK